MHLQSHLAARSLPLIPASALEADLELAMIIFNAMVQG
jgi:hypothetical protein